MLFALPERLARRSKVTEPTLVSARQTKSRLNLHPLRWTKVLPFHFSASTALSALRLRAHGF